jgi:acetoin utilization protein AcuB
MTADAIAISSYASIVDAQRIIESYNIERLPVVDEGKLVGAVTRNAVLKATPSEATSLSMWELNYLLTRMRVKEIMTRKVVTISSDATVEEAITIAESHGIGVLPVLENDHIIGMVTTKDLFYKVLNPALGIG